MENPLDFWRGKRVFVTGHTGFKGAWLCRMLTGLGATVTGYALPPVERDGVCLYRMAQLEERLHSVLGDIRDFERFHRAFREARPQVVFHLAAQPIVSVGYESPRETYEVNLMGAVNLMECVRLSEDPPCSVVHVTTDKVYESQEWEWGYRENDRLCGADPYSNSKSCAELITASYVQSFLRDTGTAVSTARAGNVIGGGDMGRDRILPDCIRAAREGKPVPVRTPGSIRPYQHVLEPLAAYLLIARAQAENPALGGSYNVGPEERDCITTAKLVDLFCAAWGEGAAWEKGPGYDIHETNYLRLDCSRLKSALGWRPRWDIGTAVRKTVEWTRAVLEGSSASEWMDRQIGEYLDAAKPGGERGGMDHV